MMSLKGKLEMFLPQVIGRLNISVSLLKMSSLPSFRGTVKKKSGQGPWCVHSRVVNMFIDVSSVNTHKSA